MTEPIQTEITEFYFILIFQGVNVIDVKFLCYGCTRIAESITCHVITLCSSTFVRVFSTPFPPSLTHLLEKFRWVGLSHFGGVDPRKKIRVL